MIGKKKLWPKPAASLHGEGLAADVGGVFRCKEYADSADVFFRVTESAERDTFDGLLVDLGILAPPLIQRLGVDQRADDVYVDTERSLLGCRNPRHAADAFLCRGI